MRCSALRWPITGSTADLRRNWRLMLGVTLADFLRLGLFSIVDKQWCGQSQRKTASVIVTLLETPQLGRAIAYRLDRGRVRGRQLDLLFGTDPNMYPSFVLLIRNCWTLSLRCCPAVQRSKRLVRVSLIANTGRTTSYKALQNSKIMIK